MNGHTHMYIYPESEADMAKKMIRCHVAEGQLHPYAGLMLLSLVRGDDVA